MEYRSREAAEAAAHLMNIEHKTTGIWWVPGRRGNEWYLKKGKSPIEDSQIQQSKQQEAPAAPVPNISPNISERIKAEVEAKLKARADKDSPESIKKKARAEFQKSEERKKIEKELQQEKASEGYFTKSSKDADAYYYSAQRQGYNVDIKAAINDKGEEGYQIIVTDKASKRPVFLEPELITKEQIDYRKKQSEEGFFGKKRIEKNIIGWGKEMMNKTIPETIKVETKATLSTTSKRANITGVQKRQLNKLTQGKHPKIGTTGTGQRARIASSIGTEGISMVSSTPKIGLGEGSIKQGEGTIISGYEEGNQPNIMSETGMGSVGTMSSGNVIKKKRIIAMLPTTKIDFSGG